MAVSANGVTFPPGPLLLKNIAAVKYLTESKKVMKIYKRPPRVELGIQASQEYACDLEGLVNIIRYSDTQVKIQQVYSGLFWRVSPPNVVFGREDPFGRLVQPNKRDNTERHLFVPVQDHATGQIHFKAYDGNFLTLDGEKFLRAEYNYMRHDGAFEVELGVLKRVLRNVQYHMDKVHSSEGVTKASSKALSLENPSNSVEQVVSRKHTETVTESKRWATSASIATKVTVSASVPLYGGEGSVSLEASHEEQNEVTTGEAVTSVVEIVDELSAKVPPAYKLEASLLIITGSVKIPFSYSVTDYFLDGKIEDHGNKRFDDGVFTGVSFRTTVWDVVESHV